MDVVVNVEGLEKLEKKLRQLPQRIGKNATRRALRKGANVIRDIARTNAKRLDDPKTSESIEKNIAVQGGGAKRERQEGGPVMRVGVRGGARNMTKYGEFNGHGKGNPGGDTFYWRFLEFGTSQMAARPFMRPAMAQGAEGALNTTASALDAEIDKELAKL